LKSFHFKHRTNQALLYISTVYTRWKHLFIMPTYSEKDPFHSCKLNSLWEWWLHSLLIKYDLKHSSAIITWEWKLIALFLFPNNFPKDDNNSKSLFQKAKNCLLLDHYYWSYQAFNQDSKSLNMTALTINLAQSTSDLTSACGHCRGGKEKKN
jgi:hypothetical protein